MSEAMVGTASGRSSLRRKSLLRFPKSASLALGLVLACRGEISGLCEETSVKKAFASAEAVIEAQVLAITDSDPAGWKALRIDATRLWKPAKSGDGAVLAFDSDERQPFEVGKTYLMFLGKRSDGRLAIGRCSPRTKDVADAGKEIEELFRLASEDRIAYHEVPGLCLPCGAQNGLLIASRAQLDRVAAGLPAKCQEERSPAKWRERVERARIDFSREALLLLDEVIGTGGTSRLDVKGPSGGVLKVAIAWTTPKGPALPIATAACYSIVVDKSRVRRVEIRRGGVLRDLASGDPLSLDVQP